MVKGIGIVRRPSSEWREVEVGGLCPRVTTNTSALGCRRLIQICDDEELEEFDF